MKIDFLKQKTFWAGLAGIVTGAGMIIQGQTTEGIVTCITSLQIIFLRQSVQK